MVLTYELWKKHFGGDSSIVGRKVTLNGAPVTVIGVLQPAPFFPDRVDALLNMVISPHHVSAQMVEGRAHRMTEVHGPPRPGATSSRRAARWRPSTRRMQQDHADAYDPGSHYRVSVYPLQAGDRRARPAHPLLLMGAAASSS